jgi:hypothetical protein
LNREPNYISEQEKIIRFERAVTMKRVYRFPINIYRFALFDVQKNRVEVASPRGYAPASPVSRKSIKEYFIKEGFGHSH